MIFELVSSFAFRHSDLPDMHRAASISALEAALLVLTLKRSYYLGTHVSNKSYLPFFTPIIATAFIGTPLGLVYEISPVTAL